MVKETPICWHWLPMWATMSCCKVLYSQGAISINLDEWCLLALCCISCSHLCNSFCPLDPDPDFKTWGILINFLLLLLLSFKFCVLSMLCLYGLFKYFYLILYIYKVFLVSEVTGIVPEVWDSLWTMTKSVPFSPSSCEGGMWAVAVKLALSHSSILFSVSFE